nr:hypothetical protein [bacterium]
RLTGYTGAIDAAVCASAGVRYRVLWFKFDLQAIDIQEFAIAVIPVNIRQKIVSPERYHR